MVCSMCKQCGHNKTTCPLNPNKRLTKAQTKVKAEVEKRSKELAWNKPKALGEVVPIGNGLDFTTPEAIAAVPTKATTTEKKGWRAGVGGGTTYGPKRKDEDPIVWAVGFCRPTKKTTAPTRRMRWSVATNIF